MLVVVILAIWAVSFYVRSSGTVTGRGAASTGAGATTSSRPGAGATPTATAPRRPNEAGGAKVELKDVRFFTSASGGDALHFVAEVLNRGPGVAGQPSPTITLFDAANTALATAGCTVAGVHELAVNDSVPCFGIFSKSMPFKTFTVHVTSSPVFVARKAADVKISEATSINRTRRGEPHKVEGTVTNHSSFAAKGVWVIVGLYDAAGKITGARQVPVAGNDIDAGRSARFTASIYNVDDAPTKFVAKVFGYDK